MSSLSVNGELSVRSGATSVSEISMRSLDNFATKAASPTPLGGRVTTTGRFRQMIASREALLRMARKLHIFSEAQVALLKDLVVCDIEIAQFVYKWFFSTLETYVDNGRCQLSRSQLATLKDGVKHSMEDTKKEAKVNPTANAFAMFSVGFCIEEQYFEQSCTLWYTNYLLKLPSVSYTLRCMVEVVTSKLSPDGLPVAPMGFTETFLELWNPMKSFSWLGKEVLDSNDEKCRMVKTPAGIQQFLQRWWSH